MSRREENEPKVVAITAGGRARRTGGTRGPLALRPAFADDERYRPGYVIASKYRLERIIGEGGMGAVWLARNLTLDVDAAIKLIRRDVTAPEASERLLREARSAARLEHASIVRVFDFGQTEHGDPFIVMEAVRGDSLANLIERKGRLPASTAVQMLLPVIDALSVAHARGVIHRDVKPDNIVLMTGDKGNVQPKLVDFGIAKDAPHDGGGGPLIVADRRPGRPLTQVGIVVGSPEYMSPEQALGSATVDHRSDIWAVCVVLYESTCGRRPFEAESFDALAAAINFAPPTPILAHGAGDAALWEIMQRGLEKDPQKRWTSMRAMGCALARWLAAHGVRADITGASLDAHWFNEGEEAEGVSGSAGAPTSAPRTGRTVAVIALAVAMLLAGAVVWSRLRSEPGPATDASGTPARRVESPPALASTSLTPEPTTDKLAGDEAAAPRPSTAPSADVTSTGMAPLPAPPLPPRPREQAAPDDPGF